MWYLTDLAFRHIKHLTTHQPMDEECIACQNLEHFKYSSPYLLCLWKWDTWQACQTLGPWLSSPKNLQLDPFLHCQHGGHNEYTMKIIREHKHHGHRTSFYLKKVAIHLTMSTRTGTVKAFLNIWGKVPGEIA